MAAQVEFFCSPAEEREVLRYLTEPSGTQVFDVGDGCMTPWDSFSADDLPEWPIPLRIYLRQPAHGDLIWHTSAPAVDGPTHRSLVMNLFAREEWESRGLGGDDKLLDADLSPILCYRRGTQSDGRLGQNLVLAPPSNLERVGPEYERWVKRSLRWIRRRGKIVHDYRAPTTTIPNPYSILNTVYALPDVLPDIQSSNHHFVIAIQSGP